MKGKVEVIQWVDPTQGSVSLTQLEHLKKYKEDGMSLLSINRTSGQVFVLQKTVAVIFNSESLNDKLDCIVIPRSLIIKPERYKEKK